MQQNAHVLSFVTDTPFPRQIVKR